MKLEWCQAKCFQKVTYPVGADPADNLESSEQIHIFLISQ